MICNPKTTTNQIVKHIRIAKSSRQREFHPKPLTEPYVKVSLHTALVIQSLLICVQFINRPQI